MSFKELYNVNDIKSNLIFGEGGYFKEVKPDKFEPIFSVTQLFETGVRVTIKYVIRNKKYYIIESHEEVVFRPHDFKQ